MTLITVNSLKKQLSVQNISFDLSDEDLGLLLSNTVLELMGYTNAPINPLTHKKIIRDFKGDMLELDYYPISTINSLKVGSSELTTEDYIIDDMLGILYFNSVLSGLLSVEYSCQIPDEIIDNTVNPLLFDIIKYKLTTNFSSDGVLSSVKEGDVQVNYDISSSLGNLIQSRINNLKNSYSVRIKVL